MMTEHQNGVANYKIMDMAELDNVAAISSFDLDVWLKLLTKHIAKYIVDHTELQKKLDPKLGDGGDKWLENPELTPDEIEIAVKMKTIQDSIQTLSAKQRNVIRQLRSRTSLSKNSEEHSEKKKLEPANGKTESEGLSRKKTVKRRIDFVCGSPKKQTCETASTSSASAGNGFSTKGLNKIPSSSIQSLPTSDFTVEQTKVSVPGYRSHYGKTFIRRRRPESLHPSTYVSQQEYILALGLVTIDEKKQIITDLGKTKVGRTRRSTANPKYATDALNTAYNVLYPRRRNTEAVNLEDLTKLQRHAVYRQMHSVDNGFNELLLKCYDCNTLWCNIRCEVCHTNFHTDCIRIQGSKASRPKYLRKCPKCVDDKILLRDSIRNRVERARAVKRTAFLGKKKAFEMKVKESQIKRKEHLKQLAEKSVRNSRLRSRNMQQQSARARRVNKRCPIETITIEDTETENSQDSQEDVTETPVENDSKNNEEKQVETSDTPAPVDVSTSSNVNQYDFDDEIEIIEILEEQPSTSAESTNRSSRSKVKDSISRTFASVVNKTKVVEQRSKEAKSADAAQQQDSKRLTEEQRKEIHTIIDGVQERGRRQNRMIESIGAVVSEAKMYSLACETKKVDATDDVELSDNNHRTKKDNPIAPTKKSSREKKLTRKSKSNDNEVATKSRIVYDDQKPGCSRSMDKSKTMEEVIKTNSFNDESSVPVVGRKRGTKSTVKQNPSQAHHDPTIIPPLSREHETKSGYRSRLVSNEWKPLQFKARKIRKKPKKVHVVLPQETLMRLQQLDEYLRTSAEDERREKEEQDRAAGRSASPCEEKVKEKRKCSSDATAKGESSKRATTAGKSQAKSSKASLAGKKNTDEEDTSSFSRSLDAIFKAVCSSSANDAEQAGPSHGIQINRPLSSVPESLTSSVEALDAEVSSYNISPNGSDNSSSPDRRVRSPDITMLPLRKKKRHVVVAGSSDKPKAPVVPAAAPPKVESVSVEKNKPKPSLMKKVTVRTIIPGLNNPVTTFTPADIYAKSQKADKKLSTCPHSQFKVSMNREDDTFGSHSTQTTSSNSRGQTSHGERVNLEREVNKTSVKATAITRKSEDVQPSTSGRCVQAEAGPKRALSVNSPSPGKPVSTLTGLASTSAAHTEDLKIKKNTKKRDKLSTKNAKLDVSNTSYTCSPTKFPAQNPDDSPDDTNEKGENEYCIRNVSINCDTCRELRLKGTEDPDLHNGGCNGPKGSSNGLANLPKSCVTVAQTMKAMSAAALSVLSTSPIKTTPKPAPVVELEEQTVIDSEVPSTSSAFAKVVSEHSNSNADQQSTSNGESQQSAIPGPSGRRMRSQCRPPSPRPQSPRLPDRFTDQQRQQLIDTNGEIMREVIDLKSTDLDLDTGSDRGRSPSPSRLSDISTPESSLKSV